LGLVGGLEEKRKKGTEMAACGILKGQDSRFLPVFSSTLTKAGSQGGEAGKGRTIVVIWGNCRERWCGGHACCLPIWPG